MTWRGRHIYLWGIPGSGKSSIGRELARKLARSGYRFLDLDTEIELRFGLTPEVLIDRYGEEYFRNCETAVLTEIAEDVFHQKPAVIALGGGTPIAEINRTIIRGSGISVWIDRSIKIASKNILNDALQGIVRPLLRATDADDLTAKLRAILDVRLQYYEQATLHFVVKSTRTEERSVDELAIELLRALEQMSRRVLLRPRFDLLRIRSAVKTYPVLIGNGIAAQEIGFYLKEIKPRQCVVITDENLRSEYIPKLFHHIAKQSDSEQRIIHIALKPGEQSKSFETMQELLSAFASYKLRRSEDIVIGFGGGMVTDIAGLTSYLYSRGLRYISVPTSLIGQIDACIGGKTAVNFHGVKNLVGAIIPPDRVIIDPTFLKTLPKRELVSGLAELLKYGLISSPELWKRTSRSLRRLLRGFDTGYESLIRSAIAIKKSFVEEDEYETKIGIREVLNFGHTIGHALEAVNGFERVLHGEAVALGVRCAAYISHNYGSLSHDDWRDIEQTFGRFPIPDGLNLDPSKIIEAIQYDKKQKQEGIRMILLATIGNPVITNVSEFQVRSALQFIADVI